MRHPLVTNQIELHPLHRAPLHDGTLDQLLGLNLRPMVWSPLAGGRLMIVGEEADRDAAHSIRFAVKRERVIELQGRLTRLQTVAALSRADFYIGGDSLWTQLAVAAGLDDLSADLHFHRLLLEAGGNRLLGQMSRLLQALLRAGFERFGFHESEMDEDPFTSRRSKR